MKMQSQLKKRKAYHETTELISKKRSQYYVET